MSSRLFALFGGVFLIPGSCAADAVGAVNLPLDLTQHWAGYASLLVMVVAYASAIFEDVIALRKSKPMLLAATLIWVAIVSVYQQYGAAEFAIAQFKANLLAYIELLLFIMVSMTYLNAMDDLRIFYALKSWLAGKGLSYRQLFWITGVMVFLISSVVNGLTAALLMGTVVVAIGKDNPRFIGLACLNIVVATNAGGSFSPLGGISTLFVWQHGILGFAQFFKLFVPCVVNFLLPAACMHWALPLGSPPVSRETAVLPRGAKRLIALFGLTIALAVLFDMTLHLPAAAGMMAGLSLLQLFYFYLRKTTEVDLSRHSEFARFFGGAEQEFDEEQRSFDVFQKISRLDWDTLLFFYGAMLGIGGLGFIGYLDAVSQVLYGQLNPTLANILIGLSSAFVDNGTLMFAVLNMHPDIPPGQWLLLTLTLGVGGSLLAIGSAPGIGLLGQSKGYYTFASHMKWAPVILLGYFASIGVHFLVNAASF